jgi:nicotinate-nucleotide adenylyltransferase
VQRSDWPMARAGMTVGLFGGSFDPPHAGHVHVSREALKRLGLDRVWWLVSPGNPLKERGPAPLERRMAAARASCDASPDHRYGHRGPPWHAVYRRDRSRR